MVGGGVGGGVQCLSWSGEILWEYILANENFQHHHDIEPLPNGNVLLIAWEKKTAEEAFLMGREEIDNPLNQMWSSAIFEISPNNSGGAEIVWEWHLWDHLVQDFCSDCPNYDNISEEYRYSSDPIIPATTISGRGNKNNTEGGIAVRLRCVLKNARACLSKFPLITLQSLYCSRFPFHEHIWVMGCLSR